MAGETTTAGCRAVADRTVPRPGTRHASPGHGRRGPDRRPHASHACPWRDRREQWYGTPVNPLDPTRVLLGPVERLGRRRGHGRGGRGLRQRYRGLHPDSRRLLWDGRPQDDVGRDPLDGVWPLAPSFDTIGPMARTVGGLVTGMQLLEPGFTVADLAGADLPWAGCLSTRIRPSPPRSTGLSTSWGGIAGTWCCRDGTTPPCRPASFGGRGLAFRCRIGGGGSRGDQRRRAWPAGARRLLRRGHHCNGLECPTWWKETLERVFAEVDLLVTPTLSIFPPHLEDGGDLLVSRCTLPVNLAGVPALSLRALGARCPPACS